MREWSIAFGANNGLIGTICAPSISAADGQGIGWILFNAGVVHRVGPHRINVRLARKLAKRGIASIRFDLAGLGDSSRPDGRLAFEAQAVVDLRSAMDALGCAIQAHRFALFGFCSGAYHGYATALADERVTGLLLYDAYTYPTFKTRFNRYILAIRRHGLVRAAFIWARRELPSSCRRVLAALRADTKGRPVSDVGFFADIPSKRDFAAGLGTLLDRGVEIGAFYSGASFESYNYSRQFSDTFEGLGVADRVTSEYFPDMDHVATSIEAQTEFMCRIESWAMQLGDTLKSGMKAA